MPSKPISMPDQIKVGTVVYQIREDEAEAYRWGHWARTFPRNDEITFDPHIPATELPTVLLHEAMHALGFQHNLPEWKGHDDKALGQLDNDAFNQRVTALLQFVRDNSEFVDWLRAAP